MFNIKTVQRCVALGASKTKEEFGLKLVSLVLQKFCLISKKSFSSSSSLFPTTNPCQGYHSIETKHVQSLVFYYDNRKQRHSCFMMCCKPCDGVELNICKERLA